MLFLFCVILLQQHYKYKELFENKKLFANFLQTFFNVFLSVQCFQGIMSDSVLMKIAKKLKIRFPVAELSRELDYSKGVISQYYNGKKDMSENFKELLENKYNIKVADFENDDINAVSIKVNEHSEVYNTKSGNIIEELPNGKFLLSVPLVPHKAHATYISEYQDADYIADLTRVSFIVDRVPRGRYQAFEIQNDSMNDATLDTGPSRDAILNGDIVLGRELGKQHWTSKLNTNGYPYWIIVHKDTIVCKEIINHDVEKGIITCHSLNNSPEFQDFILNLNDCHQLFNIIKKQI